MPQVMSEKDINYTYEEPLVQFCKQSTRNDSPNERAAQHFGSGLSPPER